MCVWTFFWFEYCIFSFGTFLRVIFYLIFYIKIFSWRPMCLSYHLLDIFILIFISHCNVFSLSSTTSLFLLFCNFFYMIPYSKNALIALLFAFCHEIVSSFSLHFIPHHFTHSHFILLHPFPSFPSFILVATEKALKDAQSNKDLLDRMASIR